MIDNDFDVHIDDSGPSFAMSALRIWVKKGQMLYTHNGKRVKIAENIAPDPDSYFCDLPSGAGRALLLALQRRYDVIEDQSQLRRDFDWLRVRYDKLVDFLLTRPLR